MKKFIAILLITLSFSTFAFCSDEYPNKEWKQKANPLASPDAEIGGEISIFAGQYPKSFNYYLDNNVLSSEIFGNMFETLLGLNPITLEYDPGLADRWSISDDKKSFTFHINPKAKWSDGKPVTAEDVLWTFNTILNPNNMTGVHKVSLERFHPPILIDKFTIKFTAKNIHWQNLGSAGGFNILPKHIYENKDFNKMNFEFPVISGLYKLGEINEGIYIKLERRSDWWAKNEISTQNTGNFQTLKFRFYVDRTNAFEAFKKGMIDLFPIYTSRIWVNETSGKDFSSNRIIKQKIVNKQPVGFQGFSMNMRKPPFDNVNVRKAMAHLLDRKKMNHTLMYDQYFLHKSYYEDLYSEKNPCTNPQISFDKNKARKLLEKAGWKANPKTGLLEKNGKTFSFKFLTRSASTGKFLAIYAEDLKDVGIKLITDAKDWAAWAKDMDEYNYQMTWASWGAGIFKDPEGMWHSKEAERKSGNNITGFKSKKVDQLIEKQKSIFDVEKRNNICREIDKLICEQTPYVLLWNINYTRLLYWNKFGTPDTVLSKYERESSAYSYWWIDEDSKADLEDATESKTSLPTKDVIINFEKIFKN